MLSWPDQPGARALVVTLCTLPGLITILRGRDQNCSPSSGFTLPRSGLLVWCAFVRARVRACVCARLRPLLSRLPLPPSTFLSSPPHLTSLKVKWPQLNNFSEYTGHTLASTKKRLIISAAKFETHRHVFFCIFAARACSPDKCHFTFGSSILSTFESPRIAHYAEYLEIPRDSEEI